MAVSVLIVDDSGFFRRRLGEMINSCAGMTVVGTASNGREAVEQTLKLKPDVITMDYEMPVMDGITAVRHIMKQAPTPILMFSSLTYEGARVTLDALEAGAVDYLPKNFEEISTSSAELKRKLTERILTVAAAGRNKAVSQPRVVPTSPVPTPASARPVAAKPGRPSAPASRRNEKKYELLAIGTSTGGPVALQTVLTQLPADFPLPILLIQHMPASFTAAFAERLNSLCNIKVAEAKNGDRLVAGQALLAPGGQQLMVTQGGVVKVFAGDERLNYKPSVDVSFGSAANVFAGKTLAVVLTGMGADGCEGARLIKQKGGTVWAQDEATCVIYGMPQAIVKNELADEILPLPKVSTRLCEVV
jgi:two-component system, chemotaxis family, protein-glutamate methylesterase/glutaminase